MERTMILNEILDERYFILLPTYPYEKYNIHLKIKSAQSIVLLTEINWKQIGV